MNRMVKAVTIVSLSAGILGEPFVSHELELGLKRLWEYGLQVKFASHALMGAEHLAAHPEDRAADLLEAFRDPETDMILCAIGGDDTYRLLPYLFDEGQLQSAVSNKIFLGFSDTTMNHLMLRKVGLNTFYGQSFLSDICELGSQMLPYTESYFEELITTGAISCIRPSGVWYESRSDFGPEALGTCTPSHENHGFQLLQGPSQFSGPILGGCIDTIFDIFSPDRYSDSVALCRKYRLFPTLEDWAGKILLLETSEEQAEPDRYRKMVSALKSTGIFSVLSGVLVGKPMDEKYDGDYRQILLEAIDNPCLPVLWNINVGHALPRCIIPLGVPASVDAVAQAITFSGN